MNIVDVLNQRYTTKAYNPTKKIPTEVFAQIKEIMRLSPSSLNLQPWHFIVADDDVSKARVLKGFPEGYEFNAEKINNASHAVVICSKLTIDDAYVQNIADAEEKAGRFNTDEAKATRQSHMARFVDTHRNVLKDETVWNEKQVYLNMGVVLVGAAALGVDATAMEGVAFDAVNDEFNLTEKGLQCVAVMAFGYKSDDDFNATLPKSRLDTESVFSHA